MRSTTAQADLAAPPAAVWAALTLSASPRPGGLAPTGGHYGPDLIAAGSVVVADKPSPLIYRLDEPQAGGIDCWLARQLKDAEPAISRITLTAGALPADPPVDVAEMLSNLKASLETSSAGDGSDPNQTPPDPAESTMAMTTCIPASDPDIAEPEWLPAGQDLRDVARQLRLFLSRGISFAIATVVGARGTEVRRPGTVVVITETGETIGFNPAGPLDGAIRDLAAKALTTGRDQFQRLGIDKDAASYIGLPSDVSLDVHAMRVPACDPAFRGALRHLDSGTTTVMVIGTRGPSGYAVIGADRVTGDLRWPQLPPPVIEDARHAWQPPHRVQNLPLRWRPRLHRNRGLDAVVPRGRGDR